MVEKSKYKKLYLHFKALKIKNISIHNLYDRKWTIVMNWNIKSNQLYTIDQIYYY